MVMFDELLAPLFTTVMGRRLGQGVMWFAVLLLVIGLIQMVVMWKNDFRTAFSSIQPSKQRVVIDSQLTEWIKQIPEQHLFGEAGAAHNTILPVTSLQIHLVGIMSASPEKFSRVIISESNQSAKVYKVGDVLPSSGVKIYAITQNGVVLENAGRLENLPLPRVPLLFQEMPKSLLGA